MARRPSDTELDPSIITGHHVDPSGNVAGYTQGFMQSPQGMAPLPTYRDFLEPGQQSYPNSGIVNDPLAVINQGAADMITLLGDIRRELMKQNPDVLCIAVAQGASSVGGTPVIADTNVHEIVFFNGNKRRTVYTLIAWSTYTTANLNIIRGNSVDGFALSSVPVQIYLPLESVYVSLTAVNGAGATVNGNATAANGGIFLYGFTIPDREMDRSNQY